MQPNRKNAAERLARLPAELAAEVIGQEHVIAPVAQRIEDAELGLTKPNKPLGSFLFFGPTGVGKTQLVKAIARRIEPVSEHAVFDMSEFQTKESVDVFLGKGRDDDGRFGAELARVPGCRLIFFDEFDKAYPTILDLFLQVLDEARLTVSSGRRYDLRRHYIALASNLGAAAAARMRHNSDAAVERTVLATARQTLRPEFFIRADVVGVFRRLNLSMQERICRYHVGKKFDELRTKGINVTIEPSVEAAVLQFLLGEGFSETDGARPLERAIERFINRPIVARIREGSEPSGRLRVNGAGNGLEYVDGGAVVAV